MNRSRLSCWVWLAATVYLMLTTLKGVESTKLTRNLGISQKSTTDGQDRLMLGPVEIDET